jgi:hypothetical protein
MLRLYEAIQMDKGFRRGIILWDEEAHYVMQKNPNYRLGDVVATAPTVEQLKPFVEQWKTLAATPQAPEAKFAVLAPNKSGILKYV